MSKVTISVVYTHLNGEEENITEDFLTKLYSRDVFGSNQFVPGGTIIESMKDKFLVEEGLDETAPLEL